MKKYDIETAEVELVQKEDWDIVANYFSESGNYRITMINHDSQTKIKIVNTINNKKLKLPKMPTGSISSINISKSESLISFYHGSAQSPSDLYYYKIAILSYN